MIRIFLALITLAMLSSCAGIKQTAYMDDLYYIPEDEQKAIYDEDKSSQNGIVENKSDLQHQKEESYDGFVENYQENQNNDDYVVIDYNERLRRFHDVYVYDSYYLRDPYFDPWYNHYYAPGYYPHIGFSYNNHYGGWSWSIGVGYGYGYWNNWYGWGYPYGYPYYDPYFAWYYPGSYWMGFNHGLNYGGIYGGYIVGNTYDDYWGHRGGVNRYTTPSRRTIVTPSNPTLTNTTIGNNGTQVTTTGRRPSQVAERQTNTLTGMNGDTEGQVNNNGSQTTLGRRPSQVAERQTNSLTGLGNDAGNNGNGNTNGTNTTVVTKRPSSIATITGNSLTGFNNESNNNSTIIPKQRKQRKQGFTRPTNTSDQSSRNKINTNISKNLTRNDALIRNNKTINISDVNRNNARRNVSGATQSSRYRSPEMNNNRSSRTYNNNNSSNNRNSSTIRNSNSSRSKSNSNYNSNNNSNNSSPRRSSFNNNSSPSKSSFNGSSSGSNRSSGSRSSGSSPRRR